MELLVLLILLLLTYPYVKDLMDDQLNLFLKQYLSNEMSELYQTKVSVVVEKHLVVVELEVLVVKENRVEMDGLVEYVEVLEKLD
jgi:hypothetical protein